MVQVYGVRSHLTNDILLCIRSSEYGYFMGQVSWRAFSNIPGDQMRGQLINWLKNHAGVVGKQDDPTTVCCKQVVCQELARLVRKYEGTYESDKWMHHEHYPKYSDYLSDVIALVDAFEQLGNPFLKDKGELLDLDKSMLMRPDVVDIIRIWKYFVFQLHTVFLNNRDSSRV